LTIKLKDENLDRLRKENAKLREAGSECADALAAMIEHHYRGVLIYPHQKIKYEAHMSSVRNWRAILTRAWRHASATGSSMISLEEAIAHVKANSAKRQGDVPMVGELLVAEIERLRAENARLREMWQPIATAPKDGTEILIGAFERGVRGWFVVFWDEEAEGKTHHWQTPDGIAYHDGLPTHWMPLPKPPKDGTISEPREP
jgi:hypothetical protein